MTLKEFQKFVSKEFNLVESYTVLGKVIAPYGHHYELASAVASIILPDLEKLDIVEKAIISKSAYVKMNVYDDENGRGNYGTPRKQYIEEWEEMVENEEFKKLIRLNLLDDYDKKIKKITNLIIKEIGKVEASKFALRLLRNNSGSSYDRSMQIRDLLESKLIKVWDCTSDIYNVLNHSRSQLSISAQELSTLIEESKKSDKI